MDLNHRPPYSHSEESFSKGEISTVVVAARACGNVKNLSLLTGYTVGRQASRGHEYDLLTLGCLGPDFQPRDALCCDEYSDTVRPERCHDSAIRISNNKVRLR